MRFDVSRINLGGRNQSITLRTTYGSLEQLAALIYSIPHIFNNPKLDLSLSGGYTNAQDITTLCGIATGRHGAVDAKAQQAEYADLSVHLSPRGGGSE